jgi:hypothetical protein
MRELPSVAGVPHAEVDVADHEPPGTPIPQLGGSLDAPFAIFKADVWDSSGMLTIGAGGLPCDE